MCVHGNMCVQTTCVHVFSVEATAFFPRQKSTENLLMSQIRKLRGKANSVFFFGVLSSWAHSRQNETMQDAGGKNFVFVFVCINSLRNKKDHDLSYFGLLLLFIVQEYCFCILPILFPISREGWDHGFP